MTADLEHLVITGGSSGIGEALAHLAAPRAGAITLLARRPDRLDAVASDLRALAGTATITALSCDVSDRAAVDDAFAVATGRHGPVTALVCSAGITRPGRFVDADDDTFRSMMDVDYFGTLWPIRAVVPSMVDRGAGSVVGVASAAALVGVYGYSAYGAAKFAVRGLLESLRTELRPAGVHVGCAFPPDVDTPMLAEEEQWKPPETQAIAGSIAPISAQRVAQAILRGMDDGRAEIYADVATRALARTAATAPGLYRTLFDRRVRSVQR